ncbi:hypothetical protein ACJQWK_01561 [Exserohilum turcicum]
MSEACISCPLNVTHQKVRFFWHIGNVGCFSLEPPALPKRNTPGDGHWVLAPAREPLHACIDARLAFLRGLAIRQTLEPESNQAAALPPGATLLVGCLLSCVRRSA